jgi:hypothetical protein
MTDRIQSLEDFWPYYLTEHRHPAARQLHFVGTSGFLASCVAGTVMSPALFPAALAGMALIGSKGLEVEKKKRPLGHVLAMVALPTLAAPVAFPAGVAFAYGCAWASHFFLEKNRPATFEYPIMSLVSDFKMWGQMIRGKLWSGDPLEELGLVPRPSPETEATPHPASAPN